MKHDEKTENVLRGGRIASCEHKYSIHSEARALYKEILGRSWCSMQQATLVLQSNQHQLITPIKRVDCRLIITCYVTLHPAAGNTQEMDSKRNGNIRGSKDAVKRKMKSLRLIIKCWHKVWCMSSSCCGPRPGSSPPAGCRWYPSPDMVEIVSDKLITTVKMAAPQNPD